MPRPIEMVWLCNYSSERITVEGTELRPYCCAGFPVTVTDEATIAGMMSNGSLAVHSGYFEGQQDKEACPDIALLSEAMMHAVAEKIGVARKDLHPAAQFVVNDYVNAGVLKGFDGVDEVAGKAVEATNEALAREKRDAPQAEAPAPAAKTTRTTKATK